MDTFSTTGILSLLMAATPTVKAVLALLVLMSLGSWSIIIFKIFALTSARRRATDDLAVFQSSESLGEGMRTLSRNPDSPVYRAGTLGMNELRRLEADGMLSRDSLDMVMDNLRRTLRQGVSGQLGRLSRSLSFLATCANAAPFIGLFGTVWGIMHSFHMVGQMKTAALAAVAPGISEALVATAIGLAVAIPATIAYNTFLGLVQAVETELVAFAGVFLNMVQREMGKGRASVRED